MSTIKIKGKEFKGKCRLLIHFWGKNLNNECPE